MRPGFKRFKGFKGGGSSGHALSGVKVQRVQRGRLTALRAEGCGRLSAAGCVEGLWKKVLKMDRPEGRRVLKFDGLSGRGLWWRLRRRLCRRVVFASLRGQRPFGPRVVVSPLRAMSIIMPPFGGHVHIEYHNHSYPRTSLRHFVALFP